MDPHRLVACIRIRIPNGNADLDPDPGRAKITTKIEKVKEFHILACWMEVLFLKNAIFQPYIFYYYLLFTYLLFGKNRSSALVFQKFLRDRVHLFWK
jgi:hypothetical protein